MTDIKQRVAGSIRKARESKGLTLKEAGDLLGVSESAYSRYESGKRNLSIEIIEDIAKSLGYELDIKFA